MSSVFYYNPAANLHAVTVKCYWKKSYVERTENYYTCASLVRSTLDQIQSFT